MASNRASHTEYTLHDGWFGMQSALDCLLLSVGVGPVHLLLPVSPAP